MRFLIWDAGRAEELFSDWLATDHKFAFGDRQYYETIIKLYTCFVGIHIRIKSM